eukprot:jgi/Mesvir1/12979/Mv05990-RA.1
MTYLRTRALFSWSCLSWWKSDILALLHVPFPPPPHPSCPHKVFAISGFMTETQYPQSAWSSIYKVIPPGEGDVLPLIWESQTLADGLENFAAAKLRADKTGRIIGVLLSVAIARRSEPVCECTSFIPPPMDVPEVPAPADNKDGRGDISADGKAAATGAHKATSGGSGRPWGDSGTGSFDGKRAGDVNQPSAPAAVYVIDNARASSPIAPAGSGANQEGIQLIHVRGLSDRAETVAAPAPPATSLPGASSATVKPVPSVTVMPASSEALKPVVTSAAAGPGLVPAPMPAVAGPPPVLILDPEGPSTVALPALGAVLVPPLPVPPQPVAGASGKLATGADAGAKIDTRSSSEHMVAPAASLRAGADPAPSSSGAGPTASFPSAPPDTGFPGEGHTPAPMKEAGPSTEGDKAVPKKGVPTAAGISWDSSAPAQICPRCSLPRKSKYVLARDTPGGGLKGDPVCFSLVGHSLGCRVILESLAEMARRGMQGAIYQVVLMGGALHVRPQDEPKWRLARQAVSHLFANCYSSHDGTLSKMYACQSMACVRGGGRLPTAGLCAVPFENLGIHNVDVSNVVSSHVRYKRNMFRFWGRVGFDNRPPWTLPVPGVADG